MQTGPKNIDWKTAFKFYCTPHQGKLPSYQKVAEEFGVAIRTVEEHATKERWVETRQELGKKDLQSFFSQRAEEIMRAEKEHLRLWKELQNIAFTSLIQFENKLNEKKVVNIQELKQIADVLKIAIAGERVILNLPNEVSRAEIKSTHKVIEISPEEVAEIDRLVALNV